MDIGRPGVNITSTWPNKSYATLSGTSMAAPFVTGTAALLLAQNPTWTAAQVISRILATDTPDASLVGKTVSGGVVNAMAALGLTTTTTTASQTAAQTAAPQVKLASTGMTAQSTRTSAQQRQAPAPAPTWPLLTQTPALLFYRRWVEQIATRRFGLA